MAGFILLMRFVSKSYSVKLNGKLTPAVGFGRYEIGKAVYGDREIWRIHKYEKIISKVFCLYSLESFRP